MGLLDVYLKLQRGEPAALRDVIVCVRSRRSQEAWVQRRSVTFVLEAARRLRLSLSQTHRFYLLDAVSCGSERSLCSFNPLIQSLFCLDLSGFSDWLQMIRGRVRSFVRWTFVFQTGSSCSRRLSLVSQPGCFLLSTLTL